MTIENTQPEHGDAEFPVAQSEAASENHDAPASNEQTAPAVHREDGPASSNTPVHEQLPSDDYHQPIADQTPSSEVPTHFSSVEQPSNRFDSSEFPGDVSSRSEYTDVHAPASPDLHVAQEGLEMQQAEPSVSSIELQAEDVQQPKQEVQPDTIGEKMEEPVRHEQEEIVLPEQVLSYEVDVRPFTDFIEEFRQAQLHEAPTETLSLFIAPSDASEVEASQIPPIEQNVEAETNLTAMAEVAEVVEALEAATIADEVVAESVAKTAQSSEGNQTSEEVPVAEAQTPAEKAGPAPSTTSEWSGPTFGKSTTRPRVARQSHGRHREEASINEVSVSESQIEKTAAENTQTSEEVQPEQSRPARRYRFDRPAAASAPAAPTRPQLRAPESKETNDFKEVKEAKETNGHQTANGENVQAQNNNGHQTHEQVKAEEASIKQAASSIEQPVAKTEVSVEPERRRRTTSHERREREKEQVAAAAVAASAIEEKVNEEPEITPEDLPPLEYSELQAAAPRRRRRRRSTTTPTTIPSASTPAKPLIPELVTPLTPTPTPIPTPASPVTMPRSLALPETNGSQPISATPYNIVSGYTVSQMNQGQDTSGPFMGPEPSPARGSTTMHNNARTIRTEVQQRTPGYPSPNRGGDIPSASLNQLTNSLVQAIQGQTDRMVTELRRANQSPTNISVSLPPFPSNERVGVFVDVANLLYSARTLRVSIDFGKLLDFLRGNRRLVRAHAYCPTSPQPGDEQMFLQAVKGLGYRITTKNYKTFSSGAKKADLDLDLCMDVVRLVDGRSVDCVVLVSGDSDFMPMLDYCSDHGVRVEVAAFDEAMSATLRQSCDLFVNLSMLEEIRV